MPISSSSNSFSPPAFNVALEGPPGPPGQTGPVGPAGPQGPQGTPGPGTATGITVTPGGNISATNVQAAITELDNEKAPKATVSTSAPSGGVDGDIWYKV